MSTKPWARRGSRQARGYGAAWDRLRVQVLARDCGLCQCEECRAAGRIRPAHEVDHIVPKAKGGTDDPSNLRAINRECHQRKSMRDRGVERRGCDVNGDPLRGWT